MSSQKSHSLSSGASLSLRTSNKRKRQELFIEQKKLRGKQRRQERFIRKKEEQRDPNLRVDRHAQNKPLTLDSKRVWDDTDDTSLGAIVDVEALRRRQMEAEETALRAGMDGRTGSEEDDKVEYMSENDSMLDSDGDDEDTLEELSATKTRRQAKRDDSLAPSTTSTNLDLTPAFLAAKFPNLFTDTPNPEPKILVTTSLNSTLHAEAEIITSLFPNSQYIRRSAHRYGHKYSVREISKFASNRGFSTLLVLKEDQKKPTGLLGVCLPDGPTFTFSISSWLDGKRIPGHGNPGPGVYPELLVNNYKTPLGIITAKFFMTLFPQRPHFEPREILTLHNQRDYIFLRRHRYIFKETESQRNAVDTDGRDMKGVEGIRVGLQELGPRMTLKLRRIDKGIGRAGSDGEDAQQWEWKAKMEKDRKRFNL